LQSPPESMSLPLVLGYRLSRDDRQNSERPSWDRTGTVGREFCMVQSGAKSVVDDAAGDLVTFDRPPLSEVVCGVGFPAPSGLNSGELGRYWARISAEYPRSDEGPPIAQAGVPFMIGPLTPRLLFRSDDGSRVVQVQSNWFLFNWVRVKGGEEYPRYRSVVARFEQEFARFQSHLEDVGIGRIDTLVQFTLNYVNHIPRSDGWKTRDELRLFLPDFFAKWGTHRQLREPSDLVVQFGQEIEIGRLNLSIRNGRTQNDPEEVFVLELGVASPIFPKEPNSLKPWLDKAREAIVTSFVELVSADARTKWGFRE
jgi:uncharacterized protein (TIGR04255 family)